MKGYFFQHLTYRNEKFYASNNNSDFVSRNKSLLKRACEDSKYLPHLIQSVTRHKGLLLIINNNDEVNYSIYKKEQLLKPQSFRFL